MNSQFIIEQLELILKKGTVKPHEKLFLVKSFNQITGQNINSDSCIGCDMQKILTTLRKWAAKEKSIQEVTVDAIVLKGSDIHFDNLPYEVQQEIKSRKKRASPTRPANKSKK